MMKFAFTIAAAVAVVTSFVAPASAGCKTVTKIVESDESTIKQTTKICKDSSSGGAKNSSSGGAKNSSSGGAKNSSSGGNPSKPPVIVLQFGKFNNGKPGFGQGFVKSALGVGRPAVVRPPSGRAPFMAYGR